jgi:hypothetical protein
MGSSKTHKQVKRIKSACTRRTRRRRKRKTIEKKDSAPFILFPPSTLLNTHKTNTHTEIPRRPYFLSAVAKTHHHDSIHLVAKPTREDAFGEVLRAVRGG